MTRDEITADALYRRDLDEGYMIVVYPMTFGKARLCYADDMTIYNGFCYADPVRAVVAAVTWDGTGDPIDGWHRNPFTGRRREDGDPAKETVRA
jgi:hypothetical protein